MNIGIGMGIGFGVGRSWFARSPANILGTDGNCESLTPFTISGTVALSTTQKKSGSNSIKATAPNSTSYAYGDFSHVLDTAKQYVLAIWVYIESYSSGASTFIRLYDYGTTSGANLRYTGSVATGTVGSWQLVYIKIPTANTLVGGFRLLFGFAGTSTAVAYFDDIRLYEVSASDYAAIGTTWTATSSPSIDDIFPYRDTP